MCYFQQYILGFVSVDFLFLWEYVPFSWVFKLGNFGFDSGHYKCWVVETLNSIIFLQWKLFFCLSMQLFGWTQITNFGVFLGGSFVLDLAREVGRENLGSPLWLFSFSGSCSLSSGHSFSKFSVWFPRSERLQCFYQFTLLTVPDLRLKVMETRIHSVISVLWLWTSHWIGLQLLSL